MNESITITKSELAEMVENLVSEKISQKNNQTPNTKDLKSHHYNTNLLFTDYAKNFKNELKVLQEEKGMYEETRWGKSYEIGENQAHDQIRKLVLFSFGVTSANRLQIRERIPARELYLDISNLFLRGVKEKSNKGYKK